jgi:hypothetical protein
MVAIGMPANPWGHVDPLAIDHDSLALVGKIRAQAPHLTVRQALTQSRATGSVGPRPVATAPPKKKDRGEDGATKETPADDRKPKKKNPEQEDDVDSEDDADEKKQQRVERLRAGFRSEIEATVARGMTRDRAARTAARENPLLRERLVEVANQRPRGPVRATYPELEAAQREWDQRIAEEMATGLPRAKAVQSAARKYPKCRQRLVAAATSAGRMSAH